MMFDYLVPMCKDHCKLLQNYLCTQACTSDGTSDSLLLRIWNIFCEAVHDDSEGNNELITLFLQGLIEINGVGLLNTTYYIYSANREIL